MTSHNADGPTMPIRYLLQLKRARVRTHSGIGRLGLIAALALAVHLLVSGAAAAQDATEEATPTVTPEPDAPRITIDFTELNDSGVTGTATLYENSEQTIVELDLDDTGENHPAHIHEGTCDDLQPESSYNLENVGEDGTGISLVDVPLSELIDGDYAIDLHLSPNELGTLIVCADIEGTPSNAEGTPVAIGGGTPTSTEAATEEPVVTETATEAPATEEPAATDVPTEAPPATEEPVVVVTEVPTEEPTTTPSPTEAPAVTPIATEDTGDGTGGSIADVTPTGGDGTQGSTVQVESGKGVPLSTSTGGGTTATGDGTQGGVQELSGKGAAIDPTTGLPATTGSGSSLIHPGSPMGAAIWASGAFAVVLLMWAVVIRRGELRSARVPAQVRWKRLGV